MSKDAAGRCVPLERQPALAEAVYAAAATLSGSTSAALSRAPVPPAPLPLPAPQHQQQQDEPDDGTADGNAASARRSKSQNASTLAKRRISFQHKWLSKYALRITSMDAVTSEVFVLACRLCEKFGREKVLVADDGTPKAKRRRSTSVKHFKPPWRSDNIAHHARDQHGRRFAEYDSLTEKQKEVFLEYTGPPQTEIIAVAPRPGALTVASAAPHAAGSAVAANGQPALYAPLPSSATAPTHGPLIAPAPVPAAPSHSTSSYECVVCLIDAPIVDTVVADVLIDSDSPYGALVHDAAQALAVFSRASGGGRSLDRVTYVVSVPSRRAFELCLEFVAAGATLAQCAALVNDAQVRLRIGAITTATVVGFVRMATAMNFQVLASILQRAWAFSLVFDCDAHSSSTNEPTSIMVRVRVALGTELHDVHVLALPATERHARLDVYDTLAKLLTAVYPGYEHKLVGIITLGPPRVTARLTDVVTQLHESASDGCYRIWSGAQHVTRVVERVLEQLLDEAFVRRVSALTGYLRTQRELIAMMHGAVCPRFVDTRLCSMTRLIDWFALNRSDVKSYLDAKQSSCAPSASWWVLMAALKRYCDIVTSALATIAGVTAALGQQRACIDALLTELMDVGYVRGPFDNVYALGTGASDSRTFVFGAYAITHSGAAAVLDNLDPFVFELVEILKTASDGHTTTTASAGDNAYTALVARVAFVFGESVSALATILQSHDAPAPADAGPGVNVPSVLPHELVRLSGADMNRLLRTQQLRLLVTFSKDETSAIHSEHAALKTAYTRDATFKAQLDRMTSAWGFDRAWSSVGELYPRLQTFCAGLATAFPDAVGGPSLSTSARATTAGVITSQYERSASRSSLVDFGLEAMLQAQQYPTLQDLAATMGF